MQLGNNATSTTTVSGTAGKSSHFKFAATKTTFDIMSNAIYNDKPRAVIRELSCNAIDAHVAAGKADVPFEIHLPTQFEPHFSITDFGTGLKFVKGGCETCKGKGKKGKVECETCNGTGDYDGVLRLHSTYFASNKNESDDMIGGFGLGSKSPFAYTNKRLASGEYQSGGFTLINRYEGKTYTYSAFINQGLPDIVMMAQEETPDAVNGVEITFPVESKDIWEFENKAAIVFEFFHPKPVMNKQIDIAKANYSVRTPEWGMRQRSGVGLRAIMGNVQYSVGNIDHSRLTPVQQKMVSMPIDLFFNIGELNPAVSREVLQLDEKTIGNILKRLDVVQDKLIDEVKKKVEECQTGWEAHLKMRELANQEGIDSLVGDALNRGMLYGKYVNFEFHDDRLKINELDYHFASILRFRHNAKGKVKANKEAVFQMTDTRREYAFRDIAANVRKKTDYDFKLEASRDVSFILNDLNQNTSANKYVHYLLQGDDDNFYKTAMVIQRVSKKTSFDRYMAEALAMLDHLGNPPMLRMSDLKAKYDPALKVKRESQAGKRTRRTIRILKRSGTYTRRGTGWKKQWLSLQDMDEDDQFMRDVSDPTVTKYYLSTTPLGELEEHIYGSSNSRNFVNNIETFRDSGLFPELGEVYGIRSDSPLLQDASFQPLMPFLTKRTKELVASVEAEMSLVVNPFTSEWKGLFRYIAKHPQVLSVTSPLRIFAMALTKAEAKEEGTNYKTIAQCANILNIHIEATIDFNKMWDKTMQAYPMFKMIRRNRCGDASMEECSTMVDYFRWADEQRKKFTLSDVAVQEKEIVNA